MAQVVDRWADQEMIRADVRRVICELAPLQGGAGPNHRRSVSLDVHFPCSSRFASIRL